MKFEVNKLYRTRGGEVRRVICADAPGEYQIVSIEHELKRGEECVEVLAHLSSGMCCEYEDPNDLIAEYREPREWQAWFNPKGELVGYLKIDNVAKLKSDGWELIRVREVI